MKRIAILFILVLSIASCKKGGSSGEDVDPREQYIGVYDIDYTSRTSVTPGFPNYSEDSGKGTITLAKGEAANEMKLTTEFPGLTTTDVVKLNGAQFTVNRTRNNLSFGNKIYDGEYTGTGLFEGKNLTLTALTKVNQNGTLVEWTQSYKGAKR
ncbi:hypothetical protein ACFQ4C_08105 [Larkinella insperata]|uniref:Lipocalin-like domain-containing protein n=1 Tax=Larkinella insperata TaxID=332158 RepID=A0ABW3Q157_9BACT|nr:hypothetical protein [Larkinella insperata]